VESIFYVESDYQPEGLAVAMLRWLEEEFSLPDHDIQVTFDRNGNRYSFEWPM
jgi:hypothetical protein